MTYLDHQDLRTLLSAVGHLNSDFDPRTLAVRALAAASSIIAADSVVFTGFRYDGGIADLVWDTGDGFSPEEIEVFVAYIHEHPLFRAYISEGRTDTLRVTDLLPAEKWERTGLYNEFYRRVGVSDQLVTPIPVSDELFVTCSININHKDFSERDKDSLDLLAPHLGNAIRNAFAYGRLSSALDTEACGIVALDSAGKPIYLSEFARLLFDRYFVSENYSAYNVPETLGEWILKHPLSAPAYEFKAPPTPLTIVNRNGELSIRLTANPHTGERTLLLEEKRFASPEAFYPLGLTKREAEILFLITQGKADNVIATLCGISVRTVNKHVEHVYQKLGVETRTAAMLRGLELL